MRKLYPIFIIITMQVFALPAGSAVLRTHTLDTVIFGKNLHMVAVHSTDSTSKKAINEAVRELVRINHLLATDRQSSEIHRINLNAGFQPVKVTDEVYNLIYRSVKLSVLTNGAFDITKALVTRSYTERKGSAKPPESEIKSMLEKTGYHDIVLNGYENTVFLAKKGMMIGLDDMITGYSLNRMAEILKNRGIQSGQIKFDGQLLSWGYADGRKDWITGIPDPVKPHNSLRQIKVNDLSVFTKFIARGGDTSFPVGSAICIHPITGQPVSGVLSVTIICQDAEIADAIATSVAVLGVSQGLKLINLLQGAEGLIVDSNGKVHTSANLEQLVVPWVTR